MPFSGSVVFRRGSDQRQLGHAQFRTAVGIQLHGFGFRRGDPTLGNLGADRRKAVLQPPGDLFDLRLQDNGRILGAEGNIGYVPFFKLEEGDALMFLGDRKKGMALFKVGKLF